MIIYKIENKKTGSVYIGKTNNLKRRMREHESTAFNKNSEDYNLLLYKKIREYGWDNFKITVVEECKDEEWEERERYWIKYYNSFKGTGYNLTHGGDGNCIGSSLEDDIGSIIQELKENIKTQREIAKKYKTSESTISNINSGLLLKKSKINYPIRSNLLSDKVLLELKHLLENTKLSFKEISEKLNISESTVKKINYGKITHSHIFKNIPVRHLSGVKQKANITKELLIETDLSFKEIANKADVSIRTVGRINTGETHKDPNLFYPLRQK